MTEDERYGALARGDGRFELRFERRLRHPVQRVWQALTDPDGMRLWFPQRIEGELRAGEKIRFSHREPYQHLPGFEGEVLECDPPKVLALSWGPDVLRWELHPADGEGCLLIFTDTITDLGKAARDGAGWHVCLDQLAASLDGTASPPADRWRQVHPGYVARFGPEAATIGPPDLS